MHRFALTASLPWAALLLTGACASAEDVRHRPPPPPEVAYRDPAYLPPPPPIIVPASAPRSLNLPLYNKPPPRF